MPECGNWWQLAATVAFMALNFSQILWKVVLTPSSRLRMFTLAFVCMALGWFMHHMLQSGQDKVGIFANRGKDKDSSLKAPHDRINDQLRHDSTRHHSLRHESLRHEALPSRNEALCRDKVRQHNLQSEQDKVGILANQGKDEMTASKALHDRINDRLVTGSKALHDSINDRQRHEIPRHDSLRHESLRHEALPSLRNEALCRDKVRQHNLRDGLRQETNSRSSAEAFEQRERLYRESGLHRPSGPRQHLGNESVQMLAPSARHSSTRIPKCRTSSWRSICARLDAFTDPREIINKPTSAKSAVGYDQNEKEMSRTRSKPGRQAFALASSFGERLDDESTADDSDMLSEVSSGCAYTDIGPVLCREPKLIGQRLERYGGPWPRVSLPADRNASHLAAHRQ